MPTISSTTLANGLPLHRVGLDGTRATTVLVAFDAGALASGRYHVYLAYRAGDKLYACDNGRHVAIL